MTCVVIREEVSFELSFAMSFETTTPVMAFEVTYVMISGVLQKGSESKFEVVTFAMTFELNEKFVERRLEGKFDQTLKTILEGPHELSMTHAATCVRTQCRIEDNLNQNQGMLPRQSLK